MNFKEIARRTLKAEKEKRKIQEAEVEKSLNRSDEDWEIISEYIGRIVLAKIEDYGRNPVTILCDSVEILTPKFANRQPIFLSDGERLKITQKDMKRFCKENGFKLTYMRKDYLTTIFYPKLHTRAYLIKI